MRVGSFCARVIIVRFLINLHISPEQSERSELMARHVFVALVASVLLIACQPALAPPGAVSQAPPVAAATPTPEPEQLSGSIPLADAVDSMEPQLFPAKFPLAHTNSTTITSRGTSQRFLGRVWARSGAGNDCRRCGQRDHSQTRHGRHGGPARCSLAGTHGHGSAEDERFHA